jgi:predicted nucleic acid-binding protein
VSLVLDCSAALAWVYQDEISDPAAGIMHKVVADGAWVPSIWWLEIVNGLRTGINRGRIDIVERDQALSDLGRLNIQTDPDTAKHAWTTILRLSGRLGLTPYDAAYLELAQRRALPFATLDNVLRRAAQSLGVELAA